MKIVKLTAENFKRLVAVEINPTANVVTVSGKNGAGKSSVLDSIWAALVGGDALPSKPIRLGENKARIVLDMGEMIVERRFTPSGHTLTITKESGAVLSKPQAVLDALIGALSFDPLAFANAEPKKQLEMLRAVVKLDVDVDALDGKNARDFETRRDKNRDAKALRAQADGIRLFGDIPTARVDVDSLTAQLADASRTNSELEQRKARRERAVETAARARAEVAALRKEVEALTKKADEGEAMAADLEKKLAEAEALPAPVNVDELSGKLTKARAENDLYDQAARKQKIVLDAAALEKECDQLTETMDARKAEKARAIGEAKMPVEGIGFDADGVTFKGLPFSQLSSAEQLKISVAVAMAANPKIRIIRIADGSLLDESNLAIIEQMAKDNDFQVWMERVDSSGKIGVVIEDGSVAAVNAETEVAP